MGRPAHPARLEAIAKGLSTYFTGVPCNLGGIGARLVNGNKCQCDAHLEAQSERAARGYLKNREVRLERSRKYASENKSAVSEKRRRHYQSNKGKYLERAVKWAADNPDARRAIAREWADRNPTSLRVNGNKRRARKLNATPLWFGELDHLAMQEAHDLAAAREAATGIKWEVDHVVPLAGKMVSGLHVANNIQVVPMAVNRRKSNLYAVQ